MSAEVVRVSLNDPNYYQLQWGRALMSARDAPQVLTNSSRSALIWSAFVVGMPCGKPL
jgi:hypothetical protein